MAMLVRAVLFAGCDHETLIWDIPSKRPHFTTERVECCNHGLYVVCAVAGIFLLFFIFWPRNGHRKNLAAGTELLRFGVWKKKKKTQGGSPWFCGGAVGVLAGWLRCLWFCFGYLFRFSAQSGSPWR